MRKDRGFRFHFRFVGYLLQPRNNLLAVDDGMDYPIGCVGINGGPYDFGGYAIGYFEAAGRLLRNIHRRRRGQRLARLRRPSVRRRQFPRWEWNDRRCCLRRLHQPAAAAAWAR